MITVAILGRPNVGKSTLFNRLAGRKLAIVHDTPGVTRDRHEALAQLGPFSLRLIDTAGMDDGEPGSLAQRMLAQTENAVADADVCLFLVDGRNGVTAADETIAGVLRRSGKPVVLVANKCEAQRRIDLSDAFRLGYGEPVQISAEHGTGLSDLLDALASLPRVAAELHHGFGASEDASSAAAEQRSGGAVSAAEGARDSESPREGGDETSSVPRHRNETPLKLAIVGRPNVGKSSLFNRLLGEERALTGPEPGLTRDAIVATWHIEGRKIVLHDTAGLRKRARVHGQALELLAVESTLNAIRFAECVVQVIDSMAPFEKQDLAIADLIASEGRAIVFAANKWDLLESEPGAIGKLKRLLDKLLPQVAGAPLVAVSALTGEGIEWLFPAVLAADEAWNRHIPTAELNRFLARALERHPPPAVHARRVRIRYMTQPKTRPPTFALFGNQLKSLPQSWLRYLQNELRAAFKLDGTPIRFLLRTSKNPYTDG